jgi:hypothetical protein
MIPPVLDLEQATVRFEFMKSHLPLLGYRRQLSSRANLGGVKITDEGKLPVPAGLLSLQVAQSVLYALGCGIRRLDMELIPFKEVRAPIKPCQLCRNASGRQILTHLTNVSPRELINRGRTSMYIPSASADESLESGGHRENEGSD